MSICVWVMGSGTPTIYFRGVYRCQFERSWRFSGSNLVLGILFIGLSLIHYWLFVNLINDLLKLVEIVDKFEHVQGTIDLFRIWVSLAKDEETGWRSSVKVLRLRIKRLVVGCLRFWGRHYKIRVGIGHYIVVIVHTLSKTLGMLNIEYLLDRFHDL